MKKKSKSKFVRGIECQVCHKVGSLQILGNYYRIRHYEKLVNNRPIFTYHRNDKSYIDGILANLKANADLKSGQTQVNHDQRLNDNSFLPNNAGGVGFEPTTTSLGGLRPIRTRLQ